MLLALTTSAGLPTVTRAADVDLPASSAGLDSDDIDTTASVDRLALTQTLPLSNEQRGLVFLGVTWLPDVPVVDTLAPRMDALVPESIELQELPAMVVRKVPQVRDHKFVMFEDRILIVRSLDRVVVVEIPRYRLLP
jgi:hypothetical protein